MGAISDVVRRYVPASYNAMVGTTNDLYSASDLQSLIDFVQFRIYATVAGSTLEASTYDIEQKELLGMLSTLQFIPAAVEYWGSTLESVSATGTNENVTYFDRRDQLWKLFDKIAQDAQQLAIDMGVSISQAKAVLPRVSYGDGGRGILVTPDPSLFPRQNKPGRWTSNLFMERTDQV